MREGRKGCLVGVGGKSSFRGWLSCREEGDWARIRSSPSILAKLPRREASGRLKLLPKIPMPRAKGLGLGREVVGGLNGEAETVSDW